MDEGWFFRCARDAAMLEEFVDHGGQAILEFFPEFLRANDEACDDGHLRRGMVQGFAGVHDLAGGESGADIERSHVEDLSHGLEPSLVGWLRRPGFFVNDRTGLVQGASLL